MPAKDTTSMSFLDRLRRREGLFRILIFTFVTILCWIGFSIYLSQTRTKVEPNVSKHTVPLNPNIDRQTLQEISNRKIFSDAELNSFPRYQFEVSENQTKVRVEIGGNGAPVSFSTEPVATDSGTPSPEPSPTISPTPAATVLPTTEPTPTTSTNSATP